MEKRDAYMDTHKCSQMNSTVAKCYISTLEKGKTSTSFSVHLFNRIKWHCKTGDLILSLSRYQTGFCFVTVNVKSSALKVRQFVHSCLRLQREFYFSVVTMFLNG